MTKYPVMDPSGKVRQWLADGRKVAVWEDKEISSSPAPDVLTPADGKPGHWRYGQKPSRILELDDVTFYLKGSAVRHWTDSPNGWKAAQRHLASLPEDNRKPDGSWPPCRLSFRYTIERLSLQSEETYTAGDFERPLLIEFRVAIIRWSTRLADAVTPRGPDHSDP